MILHGSAIGGGVERQHAVLPIAAAGGMLTRTSPSVF
jgi:hypothetical protein